MKVEQLRKTLKDIADGYPYYLEESWEVVGDADGTLVPLVLIVVENSEYDQDNPRDQWPNHLFEVYTK